MDDRIRVSDAERDHVTARLRDHFADGRLTADELDERISATLSARTFGDLRHVTADLPEPAAVPPYSAGRAQRPQPPWGLVRRRRPRLLPVILLVLLAGLVIPGGGWLLFGFFRLLLLVWIASILARIAFATFRRGRRHDDWPGASGQHWRGYTRR